MMSAERPPAGPQPPGEDPVVKASRREAAVALTIWLTAMVYTVTYCYTRGYGRSIDSLTFVGWFPDWVFWGIVVPWGTCLVISTIFAFRVMGDESLGEEVDAEAGEVRHE
jgi:hypothetical protein